MSLSSSIYIYVIITLVVSFLSILYQLILNDGDEKSYSVLLPTFVFGICSIIRRISEMTSTNSQATGTNNKK